MPSQDSSSYQCPRPRSVEELSVTDAGQRTESTARQTTGTRDVSTIDSGWTPYFRYDTIYEDQHTAIESFLDTLGQQGYYLKEGACGTGKTLAAVTASIHAIRNPEQLSDRSPTDESFPEYDRVIAVTPVKKQLQQFIAELRGINKTLPAEAKPIRTVVLRGQADMMAIRNANLPKTDTRDVTQDLRATTREIIRFNSDIPLDWPDDLSPPAFSVANYDWSNPSEKAVQTQEKYPYDPNRARAIKDIVAQLEPRDTEDNTQLYIDGIETPYPEHVPHTSEIVDSTRLDSNFNQLPSDLQGRFDPFYAATLSGLQESIVEFADAPSHVVDKQTLFEATVASGCCPHELMCILAQQADVIIGNYNHLLDPETRYLTDKKLGLLNEQTIAIVDEAHQLEERSRDSLSTSVDLYTLMRARNDVKIARQYASGSIADSPTPDLPNERAELAQKIVEDGAKLRTTGIDHAEMRAVEQLLDIAKQKLIEASETIDAVGLIHRFGEEDAEPQSREVKSLVDPNNLNWGDQLTRSVKTNTSVSVSVMQDAERIMSRLEDVFDAFREHGILDRTPQGKPVGAFFRQWAQAPHEVYHPEARVIPSQKESFPDQFPAWVKNWTPELRLFNCIPKRELRRVFSELGSGVLMSATLRPKETFREAIGIDAVPQSGALDTKVQSTDDGMTIRMNGITDEMTESVDTRSTTFDRFPLRFSPENRLSIVIDLPKFTKANRGEQKTDPQAMTDTRRQYAEVIGQVARTDGNILIAMPSYSEAAWVYEYLGTLSTEKRCFIDESSTADETDKLLSEFFESGDGILCTSLRGTITEGVDFDGKKLHTCLSIGVPLAPPSSEMDAVEIAYQRAVDETGGQEAARLIPSTRRVRQSVGRVIRGVDETGVRILADERYGTSDNTNLRMYLSPQQQQEFTPVKYAEVGDAITRFWEYHE
ncbi:helicase C-terminal domain-containing protein [Haloquadratum walsbyi]|jgi:DEAD_2.|uniref:Rad3-related DNA helicase n=1 Tax=Haloquadratum walsbyi J07HQW2 TaxID=1238425 RepID=U1N2G7_9EURY|nr:helicase C-terminal domain-containing protein [Haloquadratum walsbyi]ERG97074.1 MAG: Rad3-related DNA helicase [Haloquadratum walsbyi J07HQW2]